MDISITGSRSINDYKWFNNIMKDFINDNKVNKIISGGAKGIDSFARQFAIENNIEIEEIKPEWDKYGKSAGFKRNKIILEKADMHLIFWDGRSKGTKFNIDYCQTNNKRYRIFNYD